MPNPFTELMADVSAQVDATFGELTRIEPQTAGGYLAASGDPDRPIFEAVGIANDEVAPAPARGERATDAARPDVSSSRASISYFSAALIYPLRAGDVIVRIEQPDQPRYRITRLDPDSMGRTVAVLIKL